VPQRRLDSSLPPTLSPRTVLFIVCFIVQTCSAGSLAACNDKPDVHPQWGIVVALGTVMAGSLAAFFTGL
jgi:hypothetical protein